jgi:hypothetical protein
MKIGNFDFAVLVDQTLGKKVVVGYISPDLKFMIQPAVSTLKVGTDPVVVELQYYELENNNWIGPKKRLGIPPNFQEDIDEWNALTNQGLTFDNMRLRSDPVPLPTPIDFGAEVFSKLTEIKALIQSK